MVHTQRLPPFMPCCCCNTNHPRSLLLPQDYVVLQRILLMEERSAYHAALAEAGKDGAG